VDASHGVHRDYKGHTGGLVTLGAGPVNVDSSKQRLNSKSSSETEVIAQSDYLSEVVWVRDFLMEQGYDVGPATFYQDNTSAIALAEKGRSTNKRTRHIGIRFFFIHDRIEKGEIRLEYLPTAEMVADILTKPLQGDLFRRLRKLLLNME
jgi:hypothetical protein